MLIHMRRRVNYNHMIYEHDLFYFLIIDKLVYDKKIIIIIAGKNIMHGDI